MKKLLPFELNCLTSATFVMQNGPVQNASGTAPFTGPLTIKNPARGRAFKRTDALARTHSSKFIWTERHLHLKGIST